MGHLLSIYYGPGMDHIIFFKFHDKSYMLIHYSNEKTEAQINQIVKNLHFKSGLSQTEHSQLPAPSSICQVQAGGNFLPVGAGTVWSRNDFCSPATTTTPVTLHIEGSGF